MEKTKITRIYEYFKGDNIQPKYLDFMDKLFDEINNVIKPSIPSTFTIDYKRGKSIEIGTGNINDLKITCNIDEGDNKFIYIVKPVNGVDFEMNIPFNDDIKGILNMIRKEFDSNVNQGIKKLSIDKIGLESQSKKQQIDTKIIRETLMELIEIGSLSLNDITVTSIILRMMDKTKK